MNSPLPPDPLVDQGETCVASPPPVVSSAFSIVEGGIFQTPEFASRILNRGTREQLFEYQRFKLWNDGLLKTRSELDGVRKLLDEVPNQWRIEGEMRVPNFIPFMIAKAPISVHREYLERIPGRVHPDFYLVIGIEKRPQACHFPIWLREIVTLNSYFPPTTLEATQYPTRDEPQRMNVYRRVMIPLS